MEKAKFRLVAEYYGGMPDYTLEFDSTEGMLTHINNELHIGRKLRYHIYALLDVPRYVLSLESNRGWYDWKAPHRILGREEVGDILNVWRMAHKLFTWKDKEKNENKNV